MLFLWLFLKKKKNGNKYYFKNQIKSTSNKQYGNKSILGHFPTMTIFCFNSAFSSLPLLKLS